MALINKKIVWQRPDGGISITNLNDLDLLPNETEDQMAERFKNKLKNLTHLNGSVVSIHKDLEIPQDKTHRDCWVLNGKKIEADPVKVQLKMDLIEQKETDKQMILNKLGITEEEHEVLNG